MAALAALAVFGAALQLAGATATAQTEPLRLTAVSTEEWPELEVTLTAVGEDGQPLTGLTAGDFAGSLADEAIAVTSVQTTSDPGLGIGAVLVFDLSGSMAGAPLEQARLAGRALIDRLGGDDQAAIVTFASGVDVVQPFTADKAALVTAIDRLTAGGDTALYAAVQESALVVSEARLDRSAIVLLSDGHDFGGVSETTRETSLDLVRQSGALVFAVGLGPEVDQEYLGELARAGRGQFLLAPLPDDLTQAYLSAGNVLRQQYVLTLDASGVDADGETVPLVVEASLDGTQATATVNLTVPLAVVQPDPPAATAAPPPVVPVGDTQAEEDISSTSGGVPWTAVFGVVTILAIGVALVVVMRRRSQLPKPDPKAARLPHLPSPVSFPEITRAIAEKELHAWLEAPGIAPVDVGKAPVTIGYTPDCTVVLSNGNGLGQERVRVWLRDGRYMLHNLSRLGSVSVAGRPATWVVLEDGDEIAVGGTHLVFRCSNGSH